MNIIKHELKYNLKNYLWWMLGVALLMILSMIKFEGLNAPGVNISEMFDAFPKIVLIIFGMNNLDITTLDGYTGVLFTYLFIMGALYAIRLGVNSTALEINDKTADFIYAKPISRLKITLLKQLAGVFYLVLFTFGTYFATLGGIAAVGEPVRLDSSLNLMTLAMFIIMLLFFSVGAMLASFNHKSGNLYTSLFLLFSFIIGIIYELQPNNILRIFSPLKYFEINDIINKVAFLNGYFVLSIVIILITIFISNEVLIKKNIN